MADKTRIDIDVKVNSGNAETKIKNLQGSIDKTGTKGTQAGNKVNKGFNQGGAGADNANKKVGDLGGKLDDVGGKGQESGDKIKGGMDAGASAAVLAAAAVASVGYALGQASQKAQEFEYSMAKVNAVAIATNDKLSETEKQEAFSKLEADALRLGSQTEKTSMEVAGLQLEFAKLGFSADEIVGATEATLNLSIAMGEDLAQSAVVSGSTLRGFGLDASETSRVTDVMASSFSSSALDLTKFQESMKVIAPIANAAGFELEETTAILAKLADAGIHGSLAGTSLKNIFSKMMDPTSKLNNLFFNQVKTFDDLVLKLQELKKDNFNLAEASSYLDERSKAAFLTLVEGSADLGDLKDQFDNATGSADRMRKIMENTAEGSARKLESAIEGLYIKIGNELNPSIISARLLLADWFSDIDTEEIYAYATGIGVATTAVAAFKWQVIATSKAFKVLKVAMITSGIGAIIVLLGTAIGALIDFFDLFSSYEDKPQKSAVGKDIEFDATRRLREEEEKLAEAKQMVNTAYDESHFTKALQMLKQQKQEAEDYNQRLKDIEPTLRYYFKWYGQNMETIDKMYADQDADHSLRVLDVVPKIGGGYYTLGETLYGEQAKGYSMAMNRMNILEEMTKNFDQQVAEAVLEVEKAKKRFEKLDEDDSGYERAKERYNEAQQNLIGLREMRARIEDLGPDAMSILGGDLLASDKVIEAIDNEIKLTEEKLDLYSQNGQVIKNLSDKYEAFKNKKADKNEKDAEELVLLAAYKKGIDELDQDTFLKWKQIALDGIQAGKQARDILKDDLGVWKQDEITEYAVKSGDTIADIAKKFNMTEEQVKSLNAEMLKTWGNVQGFEEGAVIEVKKPKVEEESDELAYSEDTKLQLAREFNDELDNMRVMTFNRYKKSLQEEVEVYKKAGIDKTKVDKWAAKKKAKFAYAAAKAGVDSVANSTAIMAKAGIVGAKTARDIARVQATMDAIASANAAYKAMAGIPIVGPALGIAAAAAALGAGYANVKAIESAQFQPPAAEVEELEEPEIQWENKGGLIDPRLGSGTKDDVPAMLTAGEYVIKRESTDILGASLLKDINENPQKYTTFRNAGGFVGLNPVSFPKGGMTSLGSIGQDWVSGLPSSPTMKPNFNLDKHNDSASFNAGGVVKKRDYYEYGGVVSPPSTMLSSIQNTSDILADPTLSSAQPVDLDDITPAPPAQQITIGSVMTNEQYYRNVLKPIADRTERYEL
ncbi:MAG: putative minor tail protein [Prokaryotic dsDNA virus sp.]|nr:MAG: putative minor tail protein [Prokaryotic dsDNA virus sp.]